MFNNINKPAIAKQAAMILKGKNIPGHKFSSNENGDIIIDNYNSDSTWYQILSIKNNGSVMVKNLNKGTFFVANGFRELTDKIEGDIEFDDLTTEEIAKRGAQFLNAKALPNYNFDSSHIGQLLIHDKRCDIGSTESYQVCKNGNETYLKNAKHDVFVANDLNTLSKNIINRLG